MKKLFALLCVIALLGALCVPAMAAPARVAVAAQVPEDWTTPHLYAWGGTGEVAWPGVPMVQVEDWFVAYMSDDHPNIIINNGSDAAKTADLTVTPGLPVCVIAIDPANAEVDVELPIEVPEESEMPKPAMDTVHALAPEAWSTAFLYAWGDSGSNAGWPGVEMTKGDDGLWTGELTPGYANVIVTAGNEGPQTVDLPYIGGECWVLLTAEPSEGAKFKANMHYEKPDPIKHPTVDELFDPPTGGGTGIVYTDWYVAGTMNDWNCADSAYKMNDDGDGTYSLTFGLTAGNHALKVTNGTWDVSYGGNGADGNYEFALEVEGDITVYFDGNGAVVVEGGTDPKPAEDRYIAGTMNEWNVKDEAYKMTKNPDGTFSFIFDVIPGDYALKVTDGTWDNAIGGNDESNTDENGNYIFNATDEGKVTINFDGTTVSHKFGEPDKVPETTPPTTTGGGEPTPPPNNGLIIGIVATAVILIGGGAAVFFILKKKD